MRKRDGFALLTALWIVSLTSVAAGAIAIRGRTATMAGRNRIAAEVAAWEALRCASLVHAALDEAMRSRADVDARLEMWQGVGDLHPPTPDPKCDVKLESSGMRLDANQSSHESLTSLFGRFGGIAIADSVASAIVDWRDEDAFDRSGAAEALWYLQHGRLPPSNRAFSDRDELKAVRGVEQLPLGWDLLSVDGEPVDVLSASDPVLLALPGIDAGILAAIRRHREREGVVVDLRELTVGAPGTSRHEFERRFLELSRRTTVGPRFWVLTVVASAGEPVMRRSETWHLGMGGDGLVVRRRTVR